MIRTLTSYTCLYILLIRDYMLPLMNINLWISRQVWRYQRGVIRIHKSKKNRQHNGQKKNYKRTKSYQISTLVLLSLGRCLDRRTINIRGNYSPSSQCFGTDIAHYIYIYFWNLQFLKILFIQKLRNFFPQAKVSLTNLAMLFRTFCLFALKDFQITWLSNLLTHNLLDANIIRQVVSISALMWIIRYTMYLYLKFTVPKSLGMYIITYNDNLPKT